MRLGERVADAVPGARWSVVAVGLVLSVVVLVDGASNAETLAQDVSQDLVPLVIAVAIVAYGVELAREEAKPVAAVTVACWGVIGATTMAMIATWSLYVQMPVESFVESVGYILVVGSTVGAGSGTVVGRHLVRQRSGARAARRAQGAIEASIDGVAIVDEYEFVEVNQAFAEIFGYDDPATLVGDDWREYYPAETVAEYERGILETVADRGEWRGELVGERRDGTTFPHETSVTRMETGEFVAIVRDTTERAERDRRLEAIHAGNQAFQSAQTVDEIATETVSTAHEVLEEPLTVLWLYDEAEEALTPVAAADPAREFAAEAGLETLPTYEPGSAEMRVFRSGEAEVFEEYRSTEDVTVPQVPLGTTLFAPVGDYGLLAVGSPEVREFDESDRHLIDILVDNARAALDRVERERELAEREQRLRTVVENMPVILFTVDRDRDLALLEGTALDSAAVDVDRMVGRPIGDLFADAPSIVDAVERAFDGRSVEATIDYLGGTYQAHYQPIVADGEVERVIGIGVDVTERKKRERGIEALNDASRDLMTAESVDEVGSLTVETASRVLDRPLAGFYAYRERSDALVPVTRTDAADEYLDSIGIGDRPELGSDTAAMAAFRDGEMVVTNPARDAGEDDPEVSIESRLLAPIGDHGMLVVAGEEPDAFSDVEWQLLRILSNTASAALDRVEREQQLVEREQRLRTVVENMPVVLFAIDRDRRITLQEGKGLEAVDVDPGAMVGKTVDDLFGDAPTILDAVDRSLDGESVDVSVELWGQNYQVYYEPIREDGEVERVIGIAVDVTDRNRRERGIEALHDVSRDLMNAESVADVGSLTVETARRVLDRPLTGFYAYHGETGALIPVAQTDAADEYLQSAGVDGFRSLGTDTAAMEAFRDGEMTVVDPSTRADTAYPELPLRSRLFAPIGDHGLLVVAGEEPDAFSDVEWQLLRILSNNARAALDRVDRDLQLAAREQRLRTIVENVPIVLFALDEEMRFTLSEGRSLGGIGFDPGEVVGQRIDEVFGPDTKIVEMGRRALEGENVTDTVSFAGHTFEVWYQQVDPGEWTGRRGDDPDVDSPAVIGVAMDVTEREQRREGIEALHDATRRMMQETDRSTIARIAVETAERSLNLPVTGIWIRNEEERRLDPVEWSDASEELFDEFPSFTPENSLSWDAHESGEIRVVDDLTGHERRYNPETDLRSELIVPIGEYGVLNSGSTEFAAFDETDVLLAQLLAANTRAALERAEREAQLQRQTDQMEFFNSILRHDVLNAMTVIRSRGEILAERTDGDDRRFARTIVDWCDDVTDIVGRVRTVLETLTAAADRQLEVIDLNDVVDREVTRIDDTYPGVTVETDLDGDLQVFADELLADVVGNLVSNAVEHNDADDLRISVAGRREGDRVVLRVADDGSGVEDERKDAVFRRGETGHAKATGSGFGLFFVDAMVEEYGGSIRVEDNEPRGAAFVVTLPAA